jgi:hypothetical protein
MKRDMELIRKMVLKMDDSPTGWAHDVNIEGYTPDEIGYHGYLLVDSGLAVGVDMTCSGSSGPEYVLSHLTSAGHDFADACRNETVWNKAKRIVSEKVGTVTLEVMKQLLISIIKQSIGLG